MVNALADSISFESRSTIAHAPILASIAPVLLRAQLRYLQGTIIISIRNVALDISVLSQLRPCGEVLPLPR